MLWYADDVEDCRLASVTGLPIAAKSAKLCCYCHMGQSMQCSCLHAWHRARLAQSGCLPPSSTGLDRLCLIEVVFFDILRKPVIPHTESLSDQGASSGVLLHVYLSRPSQCGLVASEHHGACYHARSKVGGGGRGRGAQQLLFLCAPNCNLNATCRSH